MNKVSVIVPIYNSEKYLPRCLESILNQSFQEFEVVLVDDGSTDRTAELCRSYQEKDARVRYVRQDNAGPDYARKRGIEESCGEYLMFVDADDYIKTNMIQKLYETITAKKADMVCSQSQRIDERGKISGHCSMKEDLIDCRVIGEKLYHFFVSRYITGSYWAKLIRKNALEGYVFLKESVIGEDVSAVLYALQHTERVIVLKEAYYYYFWNSKSISHSGYSPRHKISLQNYIRIKKELLDKKYIEESPVAGFFAEYEMAVATAMSRSWLFDQEAMDILRRDLKEYMGAVLKNKTTAFYMKVCIIMFAYIPYPFMGIYRMIYLLTGR